ncbi:MAG: PHP domain-containing protein [Desulfocucumaceae bacterium]
MQADLHVHTTASDGTDSPEEVVARAAAIGLAALAVADHDTLEGIRPAQEEGRRKKVEVIAAIELGTEYRGQEIHVLGYLIDLEDKELQAQLEYFRSNRRSRVTRMVNRLNRLGIPITRDRVLEIAGSGSVGRPHIARAMVETGMVDSVDKAFSWYIADGRPGFEPRVKCTPAQAVQIIIKAGGVPVLAHPGLSNSDGLILSLISEGLAGIEVYHPGHDPQICERYLQICKNNGLIATGGSDYHGEESKKHNRLGFCTVDYQVVKRIRDLAEKNRGPGS